LEFPLVSWGYLRSVKVASAKSGSDLAMFDSRFHQALDLEYYLQWLTSVDSEKETNEVQAHGDGNAMFVPFTVLESGAGKG